MKLLSNPLSDLGKRKVPPWEMVWECECPLAGCIDMLTAFLGRLAEPLAVQAVWEETCGPVQEPDTGCGLGDGAAAAALGCSAEPAFWHWSSELDGGRLSPLSALHLQHVPRPGLRAHSITGTSGEAQWVLQWLPSLGRVPQHPGVSGAGWDGMGRVPLVWQVTTGSIVLLSSFPPGPRVH